MTKLRWYNCHTEVFGCRRKRRKMKHVIMKPNTSDNPSIEYYVFRSAADIYILLYTHGFGVRNAANSNRTKYQNKTIIIFSVHGGRLGGGGGSRLEATTTTLSRHRLAILARFFSTAGRRPIDFVRSAVVAR